MLTTSKRRQARRKALVCLGLAACLGGCVPPGPKALLDGERLLGEGRAEEAVRRLQTAVEILPGNAQAWNHLGLAYHASGRPAEAAEAYDNALRIDRNLTVVYYNAGCLHLEQGQPGLAADSLWAYVGLQPRVVDGWVKLGQAQLRTRRWDQAERSFSEALRLDPARVEALNGAGISLHQRRRIREAWQSFTNAVTRDAGFAPGWWNLAVIAHQNGAKTPAVQAYRHYVNLRPDQARQTGLSAVIRQLESPPAPTIPSVPSPAVRETLPERANSVPPSNPVPSRASIPEPRPSTNPAPVVASARSSPDPIEPTATPRPPSVPDRQPESGSAPTAGINPSLATVASPTAAPVPPKEKTPVATTVGPGEVTATSGVDATNSSIETAPESFVLPVPPPVPPSVESNRLVSITSVDAIEEVRIAPAETIVLETRDETPSMPEESVAASAATHSTVASRAESPGSHPLVRSVAAQRAAASADRPEKKSFWSRANPARWFGADSETGSEPPLATESTAAVDSEPGEGTRWKWANPISWFRGGVPSETDHASEEAGTAMASPEEPRSEPPVPVVVAGRESLAVSVASPKEPPVENAVRPSLIRPSAETPRPTPKVATVLIGPRYAYLNPSVPPPGDRVAARARLSLALQEHRRDRFQASIPLYEDAVRLDPTFTEAYQNLAVAALQAGAVSRALSAGETALALQPRSTGARLNFALALDQAGFPLDAAAEAERVVQAKPDDVAAHLLLGNLHSQKLGQPDRARPHYLRVIELEPEHPQSIAIRRWLAGRS